MKSTRRSLQSAPGFTVVELIAVIAVIAILVGLLVPAVALVQEMAENVSQKAQFSMISMGLEAFREDMGDYPDSSLTSANYQGAQKLAEAMIGLDGFGFHPHSIFNADGLDISGAPLYKPAIDSLTPGEIDANLALRKGPYLELDKANAVRLGSIYDSVTPPASQTFILADKFKTVKNAATGKKTGMPILYFKADTSKTNHSLAAASMMPNRSIYNYKENQLFINLPSPSDGSIHPLSSDPEMFYQVTSNPNFTNPVRPYNNESFILLSAGSDGLYGTSDDIYNFEKED